MSDLTSTSLENDDSMEELKDKMLYALIGSFEEEIKDKVVFLPLKDALTVALCIPMQKRYEGIAEKILDQISEDGGSLGRLADVLKEMRQADMAPKSKTV